MAAPQRGAGRSPQSPTAARRDAISKSALFNCCTNSTEDKSPRPICIPHDHRRQSRHHILGLPCPVPPGRVRLERHSAGHRPPQRSPDRDPRRRPPRHCLCRRRCRAAAREAVPCALPDRQLIGRPGQCTYAVVQELSPLISQAPVSTKVRQKWLDRLFEAIQEDHPPTSNPSVITGAICAPQGNWHPPGPTSSCRA